MSCKIKKHYLNSLSAFQVSRAEKLEHFYTKLSQVAIFLDALHEDVDTLRDSRERENVSDWLTVLEQGGGS